MKSDLSRRDQLREKIKSEKQEVHGSNYSYIAQAGLVVGVVGVYSTYKSYFNTQPIVPAVRRDRVFS